MNTVKAITYKEALAECVDAEKLKFCFECGICTASCPMAELLEREYNPRNLLEKLFIDTERALTSDELWLCAWCYRCYRRCPQALKLPEIFLHAKRLAVKHGYTQLFKNAVKKFVKVSPLLLVAILTCFHP
ncbi:MAG: 4Fe-4S dicluster domain-containing protein, partial [Candidatus Bathyarchaeales archaeon]